ncbi:hypothetical protein QZH41_004113 [Actinostola sp. cb2023]|nr:hypothetical protein QZH41_004113 [Actinostola sp. cb2023]
MAFTSPIRALKTLALLLLCVRLADTKECKKLDACRCEMSDGSGIVDLNGINNKNGSPRFTKIPDIIGQYTYSFNPCTTITTLTDVCKGTNFCQDDTGTYYPCGLPGPTFTVDGKNNVVLNYKALSYQSYARFRDVKDTEKRSYTYSYNPCSPITTIKVCKGTNLCQGDGSTGKYYPCGQAGPSFTVDSHNNVVLNYKAFTYEGFARFFTLVLLYLIVGIIFNVKVKHKESIPEVFPNHTFWADFPFLVKVCTIVSLPGQGMYYNVPSWAMYVLLCPFLVKVCTMVSLPGQGMYYNVPSWAMYVLLCPFLVKVCTMVSLPGQAIFLVNYQ